MGYLWKLLNIRPFREKFRNNVWFLVEILVIGYIIFIFFSNRYNEQIATIFLNTILIGFAFAIFSFFLSPSHHKHNSKRRIKLGAAISAIMIFASFLAFFVNLQDTKESNVFYIYLIYDEETKNLVNIGKKDHSWAWASRYFKEFSLETSYKEDIKFHYDFHDDFLEFIIIRNFGRLYGSSWFIYFDELPFVGCTEWGPKDYNLKIGSREIGLCDIIGYDQNKLLATGKNFILDAVISVPKGTLILLERGVQTGLFPKWNRRLDKELENRLRRILIRNNYCTISIDTYLLGSSLFGLKIKDEAIDPSLNKSKLHVIMYKAKYKIKFKKSKIGTKDMIEYYKPWATNLCNTFQETFDLQRKIQAYQMSTASGLKELINSN